jgi:hypothetical protein
MGVIATPDAHPSAARFAAEAVPAGRTNFSTAAKGLETGS